MPKKEPSNEKNWLMGMEVILRAEEDFRVTQANALIEADYQKFIPSRAQKIVRMIFSLIQPDDENLKIYKVKFEDVKRFLGYQDNVTWGRFRQDLRDIALSLYENKDILHIKEGKRELFAPWFASIEINEEDDTLEFEISTKLRPYLLQLKRNFTTYGLINIRNLRSSYSIRIYELLKQYAKIGYRQFTIEDLRAKLGIPPEKYERYSQFKLRVIQKPQEDLKEYTDIAFTFEELKTGRKVTAIYFRIYPNNPETYKPLQMDLFDEEAATHPAEQSEKLLTLMHNLGIEPDHAMKIYDRGFEMIEDDTTRKKAQQDHHGNVDSYFREKIELTYSRGGLKNPAGFLIDALRKNYHHYEPDLSPKQKTYRAKEEDKRQMEVELDKVKKNKDHEIKEQCHKIVEANPEILAHAYEEVVKESGWVNATIFKPGVEIQELYLANGFATVLLNGKIQDLHPDKFQSILELYDPQIDKINQELNGT